MRTRKTVVSLWLPIAILLLGLMFFIFIFIEYQRNSSLIEQNRTLISSSAKARLISNILNHSTGTNWANNKENYHWIKQAPRTYWFDNGLQKFPWHKALETNSKDLQWEKIWHELNSPPASNKVTHTVNPQRLTLLNAIETALNDNNEALIQQSFDDYLEHKNAYHLSPQEEIAFSLKLIELGAQQHWSPELIHAILLTGGSLETPIMRPVVDLLFRHTALFSIDEINWISNNVKHHLETFNLPSYFLDDYLQHLTQPQFVLPKNIQTVSNDFAIITHDHWLLRYESNTQINASPINLNEELISVQNEFIELRVLNNGDSLLLNDVNNNMPLEKLIINVDKMQLTNDKHKQFVYLIIKSIMLVAFITLILITLRLITKNQQRRLEYISLKEDFVKLVSHELKTPLAGIRAMAETLQKRIDRNLGAQSYPDRIINEADKLWYMVDNILGFNRVQLSDVAIDKQPTKIKPLCVSIINNVRAFSNKTYVVKDSINESIEALIDLELFSLVIKNILVNAGLYNDNNTIEIKLSFNEKSSCLLISDNGVGIAESDRDKIFKPFVRLNQPTRQSGTGLGLAMCKRIMQLHNGDLSLESSNNYGSVWKISFKKPTT